MEPPSLPLASSTTLGSRTDWKLDTYTIPDDINAPLRALEYLKCVLDCPFFTLEPQELNAQLAARVQSIKIENYPLESHHWATLARVRKVFPYTASDSTHPPFKMIVEGEAKEVERIPALCLSKVLRRQTAFHRETSVTEVNLDSYEVEPSAKEAFVHYLNTEDLSNVECNLDDLLKLADAYYVSNLHKDITHAIRDHHPELDVLKVLKCAVTYNAKRLTSFCLLYFHKNKPDLDAIIDRELYQLLTALNDFNGTLCEPSYGALSEGIEIQFNSWSEEVVEQNIAILNTFCQYAKLTLKLNDSGHDDLSLETLLKRIPLLRHLILESKTVTKVRCETLKTLQCHNCPALTHITLPKAKRVTYPPSALFQSKRY